MRSESRSDGLVDSRGEIALELGNDTSRCLHRVLIIDISPNTRLNQFIRQQGLSYNAGGSYDIRW